MTHFQVVRTWIFLLVGYMLSTPALVIGQSLEGYLSYSVIPSCESPDPSKPTPQEKFYYLLNISELDATEDDFEILIDGVSIFQFQLSSSELPYDRYIGPINHSGIGGTFHEFAIRSLSTGSVDELYIPEVVCGQSTSNGLDRAGYYCERDNYGAIAQVTPEALNTPELPDKTYVYVILERNTHIVVDRNFSGHFEGLMDLTDYEIHAFATSFETQADFINNIVIGESLDQSDLDICYATCGIFNVTVDCSSFDLSLEKNVVGGFIYAIGDTVLFDIIIHNDGSVTAYDVVVKDDKPEALDFLDSMNPFWNSDFTSKIIDSIPAGQSVSIPIYMKVNGLGNEIEVLNEAEIVFATDVPGKQVAAFDKDSTPGNDVANEDDRDGEIINILENLCAANFKISAGNEPVCDNRPLVLMAIIESAELPIARYQWRKNGEIISRDSMLVITDHSNRDYGDYSLTIVDNIGCSGTEYIYIEPIDNDNRFSCISDLYVGVNQNCETFLKPYMFTTRNVSAINDYMLEIRDLEGNLVDQSDLHSFAPGTVLEGMIINPCTGETICWSNLHIEHKGLPEFAIYEGKEFESLCTDIISENAAELIDHFNSTYANAILSGEEFASLLNASVCLQEWQVDAIDRISFGKAACENVTVTRTYYIYDQERAIPLDEVVINYIPVPIGTVEFPDDLANISCDQVITASALSSFPSITYNETEILLSQESLNSGPGSCNIGLSYTDQSFGSVCRFGTAKIARKWIVLDWCNDTFLEDIQYIFIVDNEAPELNIRDKQITILAAPFACLATIDVMDYLSFEDNCDQSPTILINGLTESSMALPIGTHNIEVQVRDKCNNLTTDNLVINVGEQIPPEVILKERLAFSMPGDIGILPVNALDAGSHDFDCGPVELLIARSSEITFIEVAGGSVPIDYDLLNCDSNDDLDANENGVITRDEIFRTELKFCCQDIGQEIRLTVRGTDQFGNRSEVEVSIFVDAKVGSIACDDGNPCTVNDMKFDDCPCTGTPNISDFDQDQIIDCEDDAITICLDGKQSDITWNELNDAINSGAIGGPCEQGVMAMIAGEVYKPTGGMIPDVSITLNESGEAMTDQEGFYQFEELAMYQSYALYPERDGDDINGISTIDLVFLQEIIIGEREIDDPYTLIAADVNNDGKISALDLVDLRRLILGLTDEFEQNKSWRFVIADFEFEDIRNPFNFEEINMISNLNESMMHEDWIGIKIGDLYDTAKTGRQSASKRNDKLIELVSENYIVNAGDRIRIGVEVQEDVKIYGLQFALDINGLKLEEVESNQLHLHPGHYAYFDKTVDRLSFAWHDDKAKSTSSTLFYLSFTALADGEIKDMIDLSRQGPKPLIYFEDYEEGAVELRFEDGQSKAQLRLIDLYQNQPNPFNGETIIQFYIPRDGEVGISFYNEQGELIFTMTNNYHQGVNAVRLTRSDLNMFNGVVYYQMRFEDQSVSRRMVITH